MCLVSVIVPLYKGKKYVEKIIDMMVMNAKEAQISLELLLVNDDPEQKICGYKSKDIKIMVLNNLSNKGIHFSRVNGLKKAQGEYILFLDQDDQINNLYIKSQLKQIGSADMVVCNGISESKAIYGTAKNQSCVCDLKSMIESNHIISPGQVLIKRTSVPKEWMENILVNNYSDDYFLWLLMLCQKKKITINTEVLYTHVYTGENSSLDRKKMSRSVNELLDHFKKWDYLSEEQIEEIREKTMELSGKYFSYTKMLDMWMQIMEEEKSVENIMISKGYKCIAVYGMGILAKHLIKQLSGSAIEVKYIIDRNPYVMLDGIKVIKTGDIMQGVDAIIVTPINEYKSIEASLKQFYSMEIVSIEKLIRDEVYI